MKTIGDAGEFSHKSLNLMDNFATHIPQSLSSLVKVGKDRSPTGGLVADCLRLFRDRTHGGYPFLDLVVDTLGIRKLFPRINDLVNRQTNLVELGRIIRIIFVAVRAKHFSAAPAILSRPCDILIGRTYIRHGERHHVLVIHNSAGVCDSRAFGHHVGVDGRALQIAD